MILPQEKFSNITVTNGQVISDGSKAIVARLALPGLSDSLKLSESELTGILNSRIILRSLPM